MGNLIDELSALKNSLFRNQSARREFPEISELFLRLLASTLDEQEGGGWISDNEFHVVVNAHMLRILMDMELPLAARWNIARFDGPDGNLRKVADLLANKYREPVAAQTAFWGSDFWDVCYVLLPLLPAADPTFLAEKVPVICKWLRARIAEGLRTKFGAASWFGPAFPAAGIAVFHQLQRDWIDETAAGNVIEQLAAQMRDLLNGTIKWSPHYYAWNIGQAIVAFHRYADKYDSVKALEPLIATAYDTMLTYQDPVSGGWTGGGMSAQPVEIVYNSVRALQAAYVREADPAKSKAIVAGHRFLLDEEKCEPPLRALKGRVNAIEALQTLFRLRLEMQDPHILLNAAERLRRIGLDEIILGEEKAPVETLRAVYTRSRERLERAGANIMQPLGVNARLFDSLTANSDFMAEFGDFAQQLAAREDLERFLATTMTEVRAKCGPRLIKELWTRAGYLHFLPLFERLQLLEHSDSFFAKYRDHTNHQLLVFLLGAYIYFNHPPLRNAIDEEIRETNKSKGMPQRPAVPEFLFRWKLASMFHDVGYIFEVSPADADGVVKAKKHEQIEKESLKVIDDFRAEFLKTSLKWDAAKVQAFLAASGIADYPAVADVEAIFKLLTPPKQKDSFKKMATFIPKSWREADLCRNYYTMCRDNAAVMNGKKRAPFLDHGMMSAAILLKIADIQRHYLIKIQEHVVDGDASSSPADVLKALAEEVQQRELRSETFYVRFAHVAGAIALHNIYPKLHTESVCAKYGLDDLFYHKGFSIGLPYALSYLLALTDGLQDWDRHSFRKPNYNVEGKDPLSAPEVVIEARHDATWIVGLNDAARERYAQRFDEMSETLADLHNFIRIASELPEP